MSYIAYLNFYNSIADSIANTYMLIEKRQLQSKGPREKCEVSDASATGSELNTGKKLC